MTSTETGMMRVEFSFTDTGALTFTWTGVPFQDVTRAMRNVQQLGVTTPAGTFRENQRTSTITVTLYAVVRSGTTLKRVVDKLSNELERFIPTGTAAAGVVMTANSTTVVWH